MLGARIALLRRQAGLSQRALAAALRVSPSAVGMYEQERRVPSTALLVEMARLFGVSTDFLLTGRAKISDAPLLRDLTERFRRPLRTQAGEPLAFIDAALLLHAVLTAGELTDGEK